MEILLEILFEIIAEVVGALIEGVFYALSDRYMSNTKAKRRAKYIIGALVMAAVVALTIYGLATKRGPVVIASLSYILSMVIIRGVLFFNGQNGKKWLDRLLRWLARILNYGFAITLIVLAAMYVNGPVAKPLLISLSALAIIVFFAIDMHRIRVWDERREQKHRPVDRGRDIRNRSDDQD